jgi:hypothetical protein
MFNCELTFPPEGGCMWCDASLRETKVTAQLPSKFETTQNYL